MWGGGAVARHSSGVQPTLLHVLALSVWAGGFTWRVGEHDSIFSQQLANRSATRHVTSPALA